jgi:hypothetical protein
MQSRTLIKCRKQNLLNAGGRDKWIEMQKANGERKRAEREALKGGDPVPEVSES